MGFRRHTRRPNKKSFVTSKCFTIENDCILRSTIVRPASLKKYTDDNTSHKANHNTSKRRQTLRFYRPHNRGKITIELEPKKEARISQRAAARGVDASTYAQRLLDEALEREDERERQARHEKNQRAVAWLQSRIDEANAMTDEEKAQAEAEWRDTARHGALD